MELHVLWITSRVTSNHAQLKCDRGVLGMVKASVRVQRLNFGCRPAPLGGCWHLYWMLQTGRAGVGGKQGQWRVWAVQAVIGSLAAIEWKCAGGY